MIAPRPIATLIFLIAFTAFTACQRPANPPVSKTITVLMWSAGAARTLDQQIIDEFTRETGIQVHVVPGSESASQRLEQELTQFRSGSGGVDVFQIDTIWTGILANYLVNLRGALADELADELPGAIENASTGGRIVAAPLLVEYGLLYYRTDLLKEYGFSQPPRTWRELETQAARIQKGERRKGRSGFWGYVWQGAEYEGLTCNALEWQSSQGGGNFVEAGHEAHVDNPQTARAFARAASWVSILSPPGVIAYMEEDSRNLWESGQAAFMRNWSYVYRLAMQSSNLRQRFAVAAMPADTDTRSSTLGGWYLGVSRHTRHLPEAIAFVRYMTGKQVQRKRAIEGAFLPTYRSLYRDPAVLAANPFLRAIPDLPARAIQRPAQFVGADYDGLSRAYAHGVHLILTRKVNAREEVRAMQAEMAAILGAANREHP
jgi:trehalose/maltose transport system substrate-binding protein